MLFQSSVPAVLDQLYRRATSAESHARKEGARKRIAFYEDNQLAYIEAELSRYFSEPERLKICFINIVKKICNGLAMVYIQDAVRQVDGTEQDKAIFAEIAETAALPVKMEADQPLHGLAADLAHSSGVAENKMDLDLITPDIADVSTGNTPEELKEVMVTHYPESDKLEDVFYAVWDEKEYRKLNYRGNVVESSPNFYKVIPFVPIWHRCPTYSFWQSGGDDLIVLQEAISEKLCDALHVIRHQGFGLGYLKGSQTGGTIRADPGTLVELPENGEVGFVSQKAPIKEIIEAIQFLIAQAAVSNGLPAASLSIDNVDESGIAKIVGNRELEEMRRDQIALYSRYESRLFNMFKAIWNVHNPRQKITEKSKLLIDFYDPKPTLSPDKQTQAWDLQLAMGVISAVDIAMEKNPDLKTREDALAYLLTVKEETRQLTE